MVFSKFAKFIYVQIFRGLRVVAHLTGMHGILLKHSQNRKAHWLLSLSAIHDIDAMVELGVPWWTYDAIDKIEEFLAGKPNAKVFEYGSGASTIWLAKRSQHVTSIEHDPSWNKIVTERLNQFSNVDAKLILPDFEYDPKFRSNKVKRKSFKNYVKSIENKGEKFDLIIIDGRARVACLSIAFSCLARGGLIVFDNSLRKEYRSSIEAVEGQTDNYYGLLPALPYPDQTTLIYPISD